MGKFPLGGVTEFSVDDILGQRGDEGIRKLALGFQIPKSVMGGGIFFLQPASHFGVPHDDYALDFTETRKSIGRISEKADTSGRILDGLGDRADEIDVVAFAHGFAEAVDGGIRVDMGWLDDEKIRFHGSGVF